MSENISLVAASVERAMQYTKGACQKKRYSKEEASLALEHEENEFLVSWKCSDCGNRHVGGAEEIVSELWNGGVSIAGIANEFKEEGGYPGPIILALDELIVKEYGQIPLPKGYVAWATDLLKDLLKHRTGEWSLAITVAFLTPRLLESIERDASKLNIPAEGAKRDSEIRRFLDLDIAAITQVWNGALAADLNEREEEARIEARRLQRWFERKEKEALEAQRQEAERVRAQKVAREEADRKRQRELDARLARDRRQIEVQIRNQQAKERAAQRKAEKQAEWLAAHPRRSATV